MELKDKLETLKEWEDTSIKYNPSNLNRLDDIVEAVVSDGSKNKFYEIPSWVKDLDDLSEYLDLRGDEFNCLKAIYGIAKARQGTSRHSSTGIKRDSNKLLHYSQRVQKRIHDNEDDTRLRYDTKQK